MEGFNTSMEITLESNKFELICITGYIKRVTTTTHRHSSQPTHPKNNSAPPPPPQKKCRHAPHPPKIYLHLLPNTPKLNELVLFRSDATK